MGTFQVMVNGNMPKTAQRQENLEDETLQGKFEPVQREANNLAGADDEELLQGKFETAQLAEDKEVIQGKLEIAQHTEDKELFYGKFDPFQRVENPNNTGLPDNLRSGIENPSGISMDRVKVHYNSDKPAQLQTHAYVQGSEIHMGTGQEKQISTLLYFLFTNASFHFYKKVEFVSLIAYLRNMKK